MFATAVNKGMKLWPGSHSCVVNHRKQGLMDCQRLPPSPCFCSIQICPSSASSNSNPHPPITYIFKNKYFMTISLCFSLTVYLPKDNWSPLLVDLTQMGMQENLLPFSFQQPPTYFRISAMSTLNFLFARLNNPFLSICLLRLCFPDFWASIQLSE